LLMDEFYEPVTNGQSVKKLGETMSWIAPDWLEGEELVGDSGHSIRG